jgi:hypothetical protein
MTSHNGKQTDDDTHADAEGDDDVFAAVKKRHGALPAGEYAAELLTVTAFQTAKTKGATAVVRIADDGDFHDRHLHLRFLEDGPPTVGRYIDRDLAALMSWWDAVAPEKRPPRKDGFFGVLRSIWTASRGSTVRLRIGTSPSRDGTTETYLIGARADDSGL